MIARHAPHVRVTGIAAGLHAHVRVTGIAAGLHALVVLPDRVDEENVIAAAARRGLELDGLGRFTTPTAPATSLQALVIGYGTPPDHAFTAALARLDATLTETVASSRRASPVKQTHRRPGSR